MPITYGGAGTVAENNAAATTLNVPYPPNTAAGDALVLWVTVASATVATLPSGWIAGGVSSSSGGNLPSERIMVKIATGSETGSLAVTTASATSRGGMMRFTGVDNTTPIDGTGSVTASATATNSYVLPSLTTTTAGCALIAVACANAPGGTWTTPTTQGGGWTEVAETTGAVPSTGVDYLIWSGSGATGTVPMTRSTSVRGCSGMLALRPAATSTSYPASGSAAVTSAAAGVAAAVLLATGAAGVISDTSGSADRVPQVYAASGTASVVSASTGATTSRLGATGSAAATSATTGAGTSLLPASGAAAATTTSSAAVTSRLPASGSSDAVSGSTGSATIIGGSQSYPASGTAVVVSSANGSAGVRYGAAGSASATSAATGTTAARYGAAGTTSSASTSLGSAAARLRATGSASVVTSATGSTTALYVVGASVPLVSGTAGDTFALLAASGPADVVSGSTGAATGGEHVTPIEVTVGAPQPARFAAAPPLPHPLTVATPAITVRAGNPLPPRYRRTDAALRR